jgi:hypothetical protein
LALTIITIRRAGAAVLVAAALVVGGCGQAGPNPKLLSTLPDLKKFAPIESVSPFMQPVHPGQAIMLRERVFNLGRSDIVLDRIELVDARGVVMHDSWTLSPMKLTKASEWAFERDGWRKDFGVRKFAGTVIPAFDGSAAEQAGQGGNNFLDLIVAVRISGNKGDDITHRVAVTVAGFRVTAHVGNRKFVTVLPLGFSGCFFQDLNRNPLCPAPTPKGVLDDLGLPSGSQPLG